MVKYPCDLNTWETEAGDHELSCSLGYRAGPCFKTKLNKAKKANKQKTQQQKSAHMNK
jgi:hypothetical protein